MGKRSLTDRFVDAADVIARELPKLGGDSTIAQFYSAHEHKGAKTVRLAFYNGDEKLNEATFSCKDSMLPAHQVALRMAIDDLQTRTPETKWDSVWVNGRVQMTRAIAEDSIPDNSAAAQALRRPQTIPQAVRALRRHELNLREGELENKEVATARATDQFAAAVALSAYELNWETPLPEKPSAPSSGLGRILRFIGLRPAA